MKNLVAFLFAVGILSACDPGNPLFDDGGGGGGDTVTPTTAGVPAALSRDLSTVTYDATAGTLIVQVNALDASVLQATYTRAPGLDVSSYQAYVMQETTLNRNFIALFRENARGNLMAGVVADGGRFNRAFGGGIYSRIDIYSAPTAAGLANYLGTYAGLISYDLGDGQAPDRTFGEVTFIADFTDMVVNGIITNRVLLNDSSALDDVVMPVTALAADGSFFGTTEYLNLQTSGVYGGIFGGIDASDVAGLLVFNPYEGVPDILEQGLFMLAKCGTAGADAACP